jgi:predicted HAD superfamily phosphohydrolase YqeG
MLLKDALGLLRERLDIVDDAESERLRLIVVDVIGDSLSGDVTIGKITDRTIVLAAQSAHTTGALRVKVGRLRQALRDEGFIQELVVEGPRR